MTAYLKDAGFTVLEADSGEMALVVLHADMKLDCLVCDVDRGHCIDGLAQASQVNSIWRGVRVLLISGKVHDVPSDIVNGRFFQKPFPLADIADAIRLMVVKRSMH